MVTGFCKTLALLGCAAFLAATFAGGDYLARVGPKPLRFAEPAPRRETLDILPPLVMDDSKPTNSTTMELAGPPAPEPVAEVLGPELEVQPEPAPAPRQATPDALLQFFAPGTQKKAVLTTPVDFSPPSGSIKSSTATYNSP